MPLAAPARSSSFDAAGRSPSGSIPHSAATPDAGLPRSRWGGRSSFVERLDDKILRAERLWSMEAMQDEHPGDTVFPECTFRQLDQGMWLELFRQIGDGRVAALERLYDVASKRLFGLALWHTGSYEDACDVVQETLVRIAEQRHR